MVAINKIVPLPVAHPHSVGPRLRHAGAQDGRQHRVGRPDLADAGDELFNLTEDAIGIPEVRPVVIRVELEQSSVGYVLCQVPACLDRCHPVAGGVDDEGGYANGGQDISDVELSIHGEEIGRVARTCAHLGERRPPTRHVRVVRLAWRVPRHLDHLPPVVPGALKALLVGLLGRCPPARPRITRPGERRRIAAVDDQARGAFGVGGRKQRRHDPALGDSEQRRALRTGRVEDRTDVVHPLLERGQWVDAIGHPAPTLVEKDET